ncbi:Protein cms1 [Mycena indigotica]|uniref:Protein cms1 n=1 Tax=Mycena indigotica TaxID=2126181 RepID=A0A8H6VX46_9AGAR|nr:Protein cms1 [Mycena indigotica]KAF7295111.1 Protein cms1 [Mycena indigotica]
MKGRKSRQTHNGQEDDIEKVSCHVKIILFSMLGNGDDLQDDFVPDANLEEEEEESLEESEYGVNQNQPGSTAESSDAKKRKRLREREKFKKRRKLASGANEEVDLEHSDAEQSPHELAEYLAVLQAKALNKLPLELDDLLIPPTSIADTTMWSSSRTLDNFIDFVGKVLPSLRLRLSQRSKTNGSPTLLFVAGAALRVVDVTRVLKDKKLRGDKGGEVAKLFAKHFKLSEHISYLRRTKIGSAVGTPGRIGKLLEADALSVSQLTHIILDVTFRDAKKRNMLDIPETREEVFKTVLGAPKVLEGIRSGKIQVVLL